MRILLIDGNSVLFRAFYATAYGSILKTSDGQYTNAVYAFAGMLNKALKMIGPDYCAVAFDKGKNTFRHKLYDDYKGGRKETPPELIPQFALAREMLEAYNIPYFEYDEIEADDIIGTLAKKYQMETCILSSDRDLLQLIDETTSVYVMKKGVSDLTKMDIAALKEEYGLSPKQIIEYKALAGDKSDNIKGVDGVGDKTAVKLLQEYDNIENLYEHIDEIKGKLKEKLLNDKESCILSKILATIKTDYEIPNSDENDLILNINEETRNAFFAKYEMRSLIQKPKESKINGHKVSKISAELFDDPLIIFDSNEFSYYEREFFGACFINDKKEEYIDFEDLLNDKDSLDFLSNDKPKTVYDKKALLHGLGRYGIQLSDRTDDLMLMAYLCDNNNADLAALLNNHALNLSVAFKDVYGTEKKPVLIAAEKRMTYIYELAADLYSLLPLIRKQLKEREVFDLYQNVELPLANVLYEMEKEGIICDIRELDEIAALTKEKIDKLSKNIHDLAGEEFNINSPLQLKEILYDKLDLPDLKKGSTGAEVLEKLNDYHPIVSLILEYRKYSKLYSTYAEGLKKYISADGRIHTVFSQTITATGRLSSYDPNLQNISVKDDEAREIRKAFKPTNDYLISCDYSQIELRVLAALAKEDKMLDTFKQGIDIHTKTAMDVFRLNKEEVTAQVRRNAKAVNFGVVYGISEFGLANQTSLSFAQAKRFIDDYFLTYPKIKEYLDSSIAFCQKNAYVKTILNRRRYINEINDPKHQVREFAKRAAMNSPIQGSAADLIKLAMLAVSKRIKDEKLESRLILQVHDELIFDVKENEKDKMLEIIHDCMTNAYKLDVELAVSTAVGKDWYEAK